MDGGAGTESHFRWLLQRGYHFMGKGLSHSRAAALARRVQRWDPFSPYNLQPAQPAEQWIGEVPSLPEYSDCQRPLRIFVKRRLRDGQLRHSYYVTTLTLPSKGAFLECYNQRGRAEVEQFRQDKSGLSLGIRRTRRLPAQAGYVLLTDLAHNLLADFHHRALAGSRFESFGLKRLLRLLQAPGRLHFEHGQLKRVELLSLMKNAADLLICLEKYCLLASDA